MGFPTSAAVGMTVQRENKGTRWITKTTLNPFLGPLVARESNPSGGTREQGLGVRLLGISLQDVVPRGQTIAVRTPCRFQRGGTGPELLEDSPVPVLVAHVVSLEDGTPLELSPNVGFG